MSNERGFESVLRDYEIQAMAYATAAAECASTHAKNIVASYDENDVDQFVTYCSRFIGYSEAVVPMIRSDNYGRFGRFAVASTDVTFWAYNALLVICAANGWPVVGDEYERLRELVDAVAYRNRLIYARIQETKGQ